MSRFGDKLVIGNEQSPIRAVYWVTAFTNGDADYPNHLPTE